MDDDDSIAIVGVGCKFPGADNLDEFWKVLVEGENHVTEVPPNRWNLNSFYSSDPDAPGKTYVRRAGFLKRHDEFDNKLFGISEIEAERMDPQQRYVLECVHMALEDGGITRNIINGSDTGVFIGFMNDDYKTSSSDDLAVSTNYSLTGASSSIISARVSYVYNLLGPSMSIDTACSSALVAIDVAAQNLKTGRCSMVICGGVNSILTPDLFVPLSRARMVSPTGQCQAFSANADGYARGEGCGIVIMKRLGDAKKEGNKIWATIATDCNQDGHTATPITAPSGTQQESLLHRIYASHNIDPEQVQVIEAHGEFLKQTRRGWDHPVFVAIQDSEDDQLLKWGLHKQHLTRSVPFSCIQKIESKNINGKFCLFVYDNQRVYIFKTSDNSHMEKFISAFSERLKHYM